MEEHSTSATGTVVVALGVESASQFGMRRGTMICVPAVTNGVVSTMISITARDRTDMKNVWINIGIDIGTTENAGGIFQGGLRKD
jgi:hypothetical protein